MTQINPLMPTSTTPSLIDTSNPNALTSEGLMMYLQTRLTSLDDQINGVFQKQKNIEGVRKALMKIQNELEKLEDDKGKKGLVGTKHEVGKDEAEYEKNIKAAIEEIKAIDPKLGAQMEKDLNEKGQIMFVADGLYFTAEVGASKEYVNNMMKQLESSAQLEMIGLQSTMSARQTAIQLATNLISALNKGTDSIAANIGR
ncbi:MAG: hypothetical protein L6Q84_07725 [Polyangiaceae bacterium]|nr:hypothetical protein [Polyangiaceae bacterium]